MRVLIIIALLVASYGCTPSYIPTIPKPPEADPLPIELRNGISSLTMGFIKPDKRTVAYTYSFPGAASNYEGYVYGTNKKVKSGNLYRVDIDADFRNVIQSYITAKFLKQSDAAIVNIDFVIKDFWIENHKELTNRGGFASKVSYKTTLNSVVEITVSDGYGTAEKLFLLKRVIEKSDITDYNGNYKRTVSNSETFIDTDISRELTEMYNILVLMTDKFIESAKSDKLGEPTSQPAVIKKQVPKEQSLFDIK